MNKIKDFLHRKKLEFYVSVPTLIALWASFCCSFISYAGGSEDASNSISIGTKVDATKDKIYTVLKSVFLAAAVVVLAVCGLILLIGTQKMKEAVKEHFYSIGAAFGIFFLAYAIVNEMQSALE